MRVLREHWLNVCAHRHASDPMLFLARRHDIFDIARAASPDVARAATQLFKTCAYSHLRLEVISDWLFILLRLDYLRKRGRVVCRARESKLARHQMMRIIE